MKRIFLIASVLVLLLSTGKHTVAELPLGSHPPAIVDEHFPSRLHAFVFRNWTLVPMEKLAAVLKTDTQHVEAVARSMGLPRQPEIPPEMKQRGYITVLRRNWHLLPYSQLLELLDVTEDELAFALREDDFLFVKLGNVKPQCDALLYEEPTEEMQRKAAKIKAWIREDFGEDFQNPGEPRFRFIRNLSEPSDRPGFPLGKPKLTPRYAYSYFALFGDPLMDERLDSFPDGYLQRLSQVGVDGIWMHIVLHQLVPGGEEFPELGKDHETRIANLRKLADRAGKYGLKIYLYLNEPRSMPLAFFEKHPDVQGVREGDFAAMCTSDPDGKTLRWLERSLEYLFREVPDLGGVFTISGSENLTCCVSHGGWKACPNCKDKTDVELIAELHEAIERGVHKSAPAAKVIAWDWGWRGHGDATEIIQALPQGVMFMSVSEWALPVERGGVASVIGEYSISAVGPGPRALSHWKTAKEHGLETVAKVQLNNSWEISAVPYLPVLELTARHCKNLSEAGISGMQLGWSLGGYPSPNLEIAYRFAVKPQATVDEILDAVAEERYGTEGKPLARKAWKSFSDAFAEYPYGNGLYTTPTQVGPANPFYPKPTGYAPTMVGIPYDGVASWCGQYPPEIFASQMDKIADGWNRGIAELREAILHVPEERKADAIAELRFAQTGAIHFASVARQIRFVLLRDKIAVDPQPEDREKLRKIVQEELNAAKELFPIVRDDSRIGYEASNHYFYVPQDLVEKAINCRTILELAGSPANRSEQ